MMVLALIIDFALKGKQAINRIAKINQVQVMRTLGAARSQTRGCL